MLALADGLLSYLSPSVFLAPQLRNRTGGGAELRSDKVHSGAFMFLRREAAFVAVLCDNGKTGQSLWLVCTRGFCPPALS